METARELFIHNLEMMLAGERAMVEALEKQAKEVSAPELRKALESHRAQTEKQAERLEQCFEILEEEPQEAENPGIQGLIEEWETFVQEQDPSEDILDTVTVAAGMKVESYETDAYNSLIQLAESLEENKIVRLLQQNLKEEEQTHSKLEKLSRKIEPERTGLEEAEEEEEGAEQEETPRRGRRRVA